MTDRELMQQALDALESGLTINDRDSLRWTKAIEALRAALANEFNPDWDAMAVMVEEQQRMAKRIEELKERLLQVELKPSTARLAQPEQEPVAIVDVSDGRPFVCVHDQTLKAGTPLYTSPHSATHSADSADSFCKSEPVAWTVRGLITDFSQDFSAYQTKTYTVPLYTAPPKKEWVGLTDAEVEKVFFDMGQFAKIDLKTFARAIEAKLKEKNNG